MLKITLKGRHPEQLQAGLDMQDLKQRKVKVVYRIN